MKKLIAILLCMASVLSMTIPVFATEEEDIRTTVVSMTLDPSMESYTLTIPPTITIDPAKKSATLNVTLEDVTLVWHDALYVYAAPANHDSVNGGSYLVNTEDTTQKIHYTLEAYSGAELGSSEGKVCAASYEKNVGGEPYLDSGDMTIVVDGKYPGAGTYTDTLTFTVELS